VKDYLEEAITESGLDMSRHASTPATRTLVEVNKASERLGKEESIRLKKNGPHLQAPSPDTSASGIFG
jgi:hypothetical protein